MFYVLLYVTFIHSSIAFILIGKRELVDLLNLSSWCLVMVERLFLAMPRGCLRFVIVVFSDHPHLLFLNMCLEVYSPGCIFCLADGHYALTTQCRPTHCTLRNPHGKSGNSPLSKVTKPGSDPLSDAACLM